MLTQKIVTKMVRSKALTTYEGRHEGTLIVMGTGPGVLDDLTNAMTMRPDAMLMVIGHAAGMVKADFIVSDHYEVHEDLRRMQDNFGRRHYTTHCTMASKPLQYTAVDHWWRWRRADATSLQTGVRIGLHVGFTEIILCGCPLEMAPIQCDEQRLKDGLIWPPPRDVARYGPKPGQNTSEEIVNRFRQFFLRYAPAWDGKVFSMSGFTKRILGAPPEEPLDQTAVDTNESPQPDRAEVIKYWTGARAAAMVYPAKQGRWPDQDATTMLQAMCRGRVCEVGCGTGRCAEAFQPDQYVGLDINPVAIRRARKQFPRHRFRVTTWDAPLPPADTYLFYTVLLHIPDAEIEGLLLKTANGNGQRQGRVVIFESMVRALRNESKEFCFHREPEEYLRMLRHVGKTRFAELREMPSQVFPGLRHFLAVE